MTTILTRKALADRWGVDVYTLAKYEDEGYIKRLNLPGVRYSLAAIEAIEADGKDNLIVKKNREIQELYDTVKKLTEKLKMAKEILGG